MTTAKPQHAGQSDSADDLIAELAKLMADDVQSARPAAGTAAPAEEPAAAPKPAAPAAPPVRIPGGFDSFAPPPTTPPTRELFSRPAQQSARPDPFAPSAQPTPRPDFGRTAQNPATEPERPHESQPADTRISSFPALGNGRSSPFQPVPAVEPKPAPAPVRPAASSITDQVFGGQRPVAAAPVGPASAAKDAEDFEFDFGFGENAETETSSEPVFGKSLPDEPAPEVEAVEADLVAELAGLVADQQQETPAVPPRVEPEVEDEEEDPIAALIAAEVAEPVEDEAPPQPYEPPVVARAAPVAPARPVAPVVSAPEASPFTPTPLARRMQEPTFRRRPESDAFSVPPVFDFNANAQPTREQPVASPPAVNDPIDEIESLIGEAVHVDLPPNRQARPAAPANPISRKLDTSFPIGRPARQPAEEQFEPAAPRVDAEFAEFEGDDSDDYRVARDPRDDGARDDVAYMAEDEPRARRNVRQYVGLAVAGTFLLVAGLGLYWVLGMNGGGGDGSAAPVLTADNAPAKQAPAEPVVAAADSPRSAVFDEIGGTTTPPEQEALVPRDETATAPVEAARVIDPAASEEGLANRRVRTVTVRPDGTIVSGDIAGTELLPVDRPAVPDVPGAGQSEDVTNILAAASALTAPQAQVPASTAPAGSAPMALTPNSATTAVTADGTVVPMPLPRPANLPAPTSRPVTALVSEPVAALPQAAAPADSVDLIGNLAAQVTQPAAPVQAPAPQQTAAVTAPSSGAAAYVQLSSQRTEADARASLNSIQQRWGSLFGGNALEIQRADLGARGIYYRVRLPAGSAAQANQICSNIKANGGDCFATD